MGKKERLWLVIVVVLLVLDCLWIVHSLSLLSVLW